LAEHVQNLGVIVNYLLRKKASHCQFDDSFPCKKIKKSKIITFWFWYVVLFDLISHLEV